jgi:hypothetical protein
MRRRTLQRSEEAEHRAVGVIKRAVGPLPRAMRGCIAKRGCAQREVVKSP